VRITWQRCGGLAYLPGLQRPLVVDLATLPAAQAQALRQLVDDACLDTLPPTVDLQPPGGDRQHDLLTVEDETTGRCQTVQVGVPGGSPALRALVHALRQHARASRGGAA
jgi:hypothetical protein